MLALVSICITGLSGCKRPQANSKNKLDDATTKRAAQSLGFGRIEGASMAPLYLGKHFSTTCPNCQYPFDVDAESPLTDRKVVCPICGHPFQLRESLEPSQATRVELIKIPDEASPDRWSVVAFRQANQNSIKRIVGLPGELISIRHGDVYVDQRPCIKSPEIQLQTRILMFDTARWTGEQLKVETDKDAGKFPMSLGKPFNIRYLQLPNYLSRSSRKPERIKDFYGYNQSITRSLNPCHDIGCEVTINLVGGNGDLGVGNKIQNCFEIQLQTEIYGTVNFEMKVCTERINYEISQNGRIAFKGVYELSNTRRTKEIFASIIDGRARIYFGDQKDRSAELELLDEKFMVEPGNSVILKNDGASNEEAQNTKTTNNSKAVDAPASLLNLRIYRDIHYFEKIEQEPKQLGKDEFFVIGDNVPVSKDSRNSGVFPRRIDLIGIVR